MRKRLRALLILVALAAPGCRGLLLAEGDSRGRKTAKVAGRVVQGAATWGVSEVIYAGRRAGR